jgi:hypothetical protein
VTYDYSEDRTAADEAIAEYGQSGYLRRTAAGSGADPWNPGSGTVTDYPIRFVLVDYSERDRDGTLIQQNDQQALISVGSLPTEATDADQLVDSQSKVFEIVAIRPLEPGGTVVLYTAQVRR